MISFGFPIMVNSNTSVLRKGKEAVNSNLQLLFQSAKRSLFGDPYFGNDLMGNFYENESSLIKDVMIDEVYQMIVDFMPHIYVERKGITISFDENKNLVLRVFYIYLEDNTSNLYDIQLTQDN